MPLSRLAWWRGLFVAEIRLADFLIRMLLGQPSLSVLHLQSGCRQGVRLRRPTSE
jgi:hypothetical protein